MKIGIYPGSFDPVTNGHLNMIERASRLFDRLIVVILKNTNKKQSLLSMEERKALLKEVTLHLNNVQIDSFEGLLVEYASLKEAQFIVRGIRSYNDLDSEQSLAHINYRLNPDVETVFLMTDERYRMISSSFVKELHHFHGDYKWMVPEAVYHKLEKIEG